MKTRSERIYVGKGTFSLLLWRILLNNKWKPQYFTIVVRGVAHGYVYFGVKYIKVTPLKPIINLRIPIKVGPIRKALNFGRIFPSSKTAHRRLQKLQTSCPEPYETKEVFIKAPLICLHSINGISVTVEVKAGNYVYYSQKYRYIWCDPTSGELSFSNWETSGSVAAICDSPIPINREKWNKNVLYCILWSNYFNY